MRVRRWPAAVIVVGGWALLQLMVLYGCPASAAQAPTKKHRRSFADNLHSGIKLAGSIFGLDTTADVANLVAKAFAKPQQPAASRRKSQSGRQSTAAGGRPDPAAEQFGSMAPPGMLSHVLRMIGLDSGKIGAMAVNGIIFMAQMVSESVFVLGLAMQQSLWDWWVILQYVVRRVLEANQPTPPPVETIGV